MEQKAAPEAQPRKRRHCETAASLSESPDGQWHHPRKNIVNIAPVLPYRRGVLPGLHTLRQKYGRWGGGREAHISFHGEKRGYLPHFHRECHQIKESYGWTLSLKCLRTTSIVFKMQV